jgi:hypothetical protein
MREAAALRLRRTRAPYTRLVAPLQAGLRLERFGLVVRAQRFDDVLDLAVHDRGQVVLGQADPVIGDAINKNKDEPIFQVPQLGIVAEWEKAVPELSASISEIKKIKRIKANRD